MFSKEEKTKWIEKQIKMLGYCQEDLNQNHVGKLKTLEIEKEILEEYLETRNFLDGLDGIIIGKNLTDGEKEKISKQITEYKSKGGEICIVHQTKPEDLAR